MSGTASVSFRSLVLPKEHGSWSFAFEPVLLGLLVAPSRAGLVLGLAVVAGFFVRRPLKLAVTLPADDERRIPAVKWTILWSALSFAGIVVTAQLESWSALWSLLLCAPFAAIFLWFDLRNVMREAEAELAGSTTFALLPATLAILAGWSTAPALGLAALMLARSLPTVLIVRTYLRHAKGQKANSTGALIAAGVAFAGIAALAWKGVVPVFGGLLAAGLFLRSLILLTSLRPSWPARRIGQGEAVIGALYLIGLSVAYQFQR